MHITKHKKRFLKHLTEDLGRSETTIASYGRYLDVFIAKTRVTEAESITRNRVATFKKYLGEPDSNGQFRTAKTQDYYLIALRAFLKYLAALGVQSLSPRQVVLHNQARAPEHVSLRASDVARWRRQPNCATPVGRRDQAIMEVLLATGLRVSALCSLARSQFNVKTGCLSVTRSTGEMQVVRLPSDATKALREYLRKRIDTHPALFVPHGKNAQLMLVTSLSPRSIERRLERYRVAAGVGTPMTPNVIRRYVAAKLQERGASLTDLQVHLGHRHAVSTEAFFTRNRPASPYRQVKKAH